LIASFLTVGPNKVTIYDSTFSRFASMLSGSNTDPTRVSVAWMLINVPIGSTIEVQERPGGMHRPNPPLAVPRTEVISNPFVIRTNHTVANQYTSDSGIPIDCPREPPQDARLIVDIEVGRYAAASVGNPASAMARSASS
jgi:hypothetical protein